jgi:hypothetical protein
MRSQRIILLATLVISVHSQRLPDARAERGYELGLGSATHRLATGSADALTDDNLVMVSVSGALALPSLSLHGFAVDLAAAFDHGGVDGTTFGTMSTATRMTAATLGLRARRALSRRWLLHGRAAAGAARVSVELDDYYSGAGALYDRGYAGCMQVGGGGDLILLGAGRRGLSLVLRAELGYSAMSAVELRGAPEDRMDDDIIRIPEMYTSLGELDLSAWNARLSLVGRF